MDVGTLSGIIVICAGFVIMALIAIWLVYNKRKRYREKESEEMDESRYPKQVPVWLVRDG